MKKSHKVILAAIAVVVLLMPVAAFLEGYLVERV